MQDMLTLTFNQQQPQAQGYWLQTWTRTDNNPHQLPIQFTLHQKNPNQPGHNTYLMQQTPTGKLQFLSPQKHQHPQTLTLPIQLYCQWQNQQHPPFLHRLLPPKQLKTTLTQWYHHLKTPNLLITAQGPQIATAIHLIQQLKQHQLLTPQNTTPPKIAALLQADNQGKLPFQPKPAQILFPELATIAPEAIGALPLLEDWHIPNRLSNPQGQPGCTPHNLTTLIKNWQQHTGKNQWQQQWQILSL